MPVSTPGGVKIVWKQVFTHLSFRPKSSCRHNNDMCGSIESYFEFCGGLTAVSGTHDCKVALGRPADDAEFGGKLLRALDGMDVAPFSRMDDGML